MFLHTDTLETLELCVGRRGQRGNCALMTQTVYEASFAGRTRGIRWGHVYTIANSETLELCVGRRGRRGNCAPITQTVYEASFAGRTRGVRWGHVSVLSAWRLRWFWRVPSRGSTESRATSRR